jgi:hypothetical protein
MADVPDATVGASNEVTTPTPEVAPSAVDTNSSINELVAAARQEAENAHSHALAMQAWAECVSSWAGLHRDGEFNPFEACGDQPTPTDFDLGKSLPGSAPDDGSDQAKPEKTDDAEKPDKDKPQTDDPEEEPEADESEQDPPDPADD